MNQRVCVLVLSIALTPLLARAEKTTAVGPSDGNQIKAPEQDMANMNHASPTADPKMGTADQIEEAKLIETLREVAQAKAQANPKYRDVIMAAYEKVAEDIRNDPAKSYSANQGEVLGPMIDLQVREQQEKSELWRDRREGKLKPGEFEKRMKDIEALTMSGMHGIPGGVVMDYFHNEFSKAWAENHPKWGRPDESPTAFPPGGHIGDMLQKWPNNPSTWALSAQKKLAAGDIAGGKADLERSIANGGTADAFALRGGIKLDAKDYEGAYKDAKKALEMNPSDMNARGILKSAEGRVSPETVSALSVGSTGGPGGGAGQGGFGGLSRTGGSASFGVPGMTSAGALSSGQKLDEARSAMSMSDWQAAIAAAKRAIELNGGNAQAYALLSNAYAHKGDYKSALEAAKSGLEKNPRDAELLNRKAFAENRLKHWRDAVDTSNNAIEADPHGAFGYANRAHAYGGLGDKDAMASDLERAAARDSFYQRAAADAAAMQLPTNADVLFLFPGESPEASAPSGAAPRARNFGVVAGTAALGGILLALGLLSTVLAPVKDSLVSAFTKATRRGPSLHALETNDAAATQEPASVAGNAGGLLRGQYEIKRQIGQGGMGMVYEGLDRSLGRRVAIKKMREELRMNPRDRERFIIEAKTVASLHHSNIVDIYSIVEDGDDVYLVFEYVDGRTVHDSLQAEGRLSRPDALKITHAMADALAYAHAHGVIHRDMKPSNVMQTVSGAVKVMDFGIARMAKDALTRYSMTNTVVGTPPYMAPEQEQGVVRKESDVYSLAICSYEMLTGKLPFIGLGAGMLMNKINMSYIPPSRAIAGLPESLDEVFLKAFQADPDNRYRTPQEFAAALGGVPERI